MQLEFLKLIIFKKLYYKNKIILKIKYNYRFNKNLGGNLVFCFNIKDYIIFIFFNIIYLIVSKKNHMSSLNFMIKNFHFLIYTVKGVWIK